MLTVAVAVFGFAIGEIVSLRTFFLQPSEESGPFRRALRANSRGFLTMTGIMALYLLAGHLLWRLGAIN